jgi:hypothetical protein
MDLNKDIGSDADKDKWSDLHQEVVQRCVVTF